jgi:hypothetical protein
MEATVVLVLFLVVVCGGMTFMLAAGYQNVERDRARSAAHQRRPARTDIGAPALPAVPGFLLASGAPTLTGPFVFDDAMVRRLEQHIRGEQARVTQFVQHPSVDNLYHPTGTGLRAH